MNHCFANGKKSIEALPAILSGVPTLMNDPLINSSYSLNNIESFASYLKPHGYTSTFFHGGKNGTMNFNGFINAAQFDAYFGKDEYANDADYDGTWGIYDEAFLQYFCKTLTETKKPFITSVFTLSSHHPYSIPKEYAGKFTEGETPLEKTVQYTDLSLKKFFESAEKQTWYKNTVFVITADHTPYTTTPEFLTNYGMYHIPLLLFDPSADSSYTLAKTCQQIDILPTVLDYINFPDSVFSFGQSVFASNPGFAIQYINNQHQIIEDSSLLIMNRGIPISYFSPSTDRLLNNNIINQNSPPQQQSSRRLQAIVQDYNARMIDNKLTVAQ
jgi:phosphoglycerol transferase MdoB-like AlkP superfamily enzyme